MTNIEELKVAVEKYRLLRTHGFPFLMPILKSLHGQSEEVIAIQMKTMIHNHVASKYEKITTTTGISAKIVDWKEAFWEVINETFIKVGLPREEIALRALKKAKNNILWSGDVDLAIEKQGIDITGNGYAMGISVKGYNFHNNWDYQKHIDQLKANKFKSCYIAFVDEVNKKMRVERVDK